MEFLIKDILKDFLTFLLLLMLLKYIRDLILWLGHTIEISKIDNRKDDMTQIFH